MYRRLRNPKEQKKRNARHFAALVALFAAFVSVCSFQIRCAGIRKEILRLHVIACSDDAADQEAKLLVRDAILAAGADIFDGSVTAAQAQESITPRVAALEDVAKNALRKQGLNYNVTITVQPDYFNTRSYEDVTLPAGRYNAVRVLLGEAKGKNWWCVMFPPLCLPAAAKKNTVRMDALLTQGQLRIVNANPQFEIRFKIVEIWERFKEKLRGRDASL
jgi:stage II sporulation protein R